MLTDVFANFINLSLKDIKLDPSHYYSAPGLSSDTMLKMTEKQKKFPTQISIYLLREL